MKVYRSDFSLKPECKKTESFATGAPV